MCAKKFSISHVQTTDLCINPIDIKSFCIEINYKRYKNILFTIKYRPRKVDKAISENFCKNLFSANSKTSKILIYAGDLNINILDYKSNKKVQHFLSSMFQYNMIPTINKPTRREMQPQLLITLIHIYGAEQIELFKHELSQIEWNSIIILTP